MGAPQAEAAVTSVTFGFGSVFNKADGVGFFQTTPNLGQLGGYAGRGFSLLGYYTTGNVYNQNQKPYFGSSRGTPSFFASGTVIGNGLNGALGVSYFSNPYDSNLDLPTDQLNKNIGFQTDTGNFGWANVSWDASAKALTINSAYIESVANTPITIVGAAVTPEPSRALLALAGLGAAGLRRRRKQAA
jgi:MYXO-CTERM domain-containing protein